MKDFFDGISSYGKAIQLVGRLGLWGYVLVPGLLSLLLAIVMLSLAWGFSDELGQLLTAWMPGLEGKGVAEWAARIAGALLILSAGLIIFKQLVMALASPIMSPLSEKVERYMAGDAHHEIRFSIPQVLSDMARGIAISLRNIIRELLLTVLLLILGLIPPVGLITPVLLFAVQAYYAGFGNMDYTLERHFRLRDSVRFVRRRRMLAVGNGTVFMLLLLTGVGFLFALPLGTVAATIETTKRLKSA